MSPLSVLAIDPGPERSAWILLDGDTVLSHGLEPNAIFAPPVHLAHEIAIECLACYGMPVGAEIFETAYWIGQLFERWKVRTRPVRRILRRDVKLHLCGSARAKDGNVRRAILDRYPRTGGGACPQVGTKAQPGPLYGVRRDVWAALAVGITAQAQIAAEAKETER